MSSLVAKIAPWAIIVAVLFGALQLEKARAREAGRVEVLTEQRDSALAVLDSSRVADSLRVVELQGVVDTASAATEALRIANDSLANELDDALTRVPDVVVREVIRAVVDTLQAECDSCAVALEASKEQSAQLLLSWNTEKREHDNTRALLDRVQERSSQSIFHFDVTFGAGAVYDFSDQKIKVGPGLTAGVSVCIKCLFGG